MQSIANDKSLGNRTRGQFDSQSSEAESENSLQSARTARDVLVLRDCDALAAAHCVKKLFRSGTDTVGLSVPQARGCSRRQWKFQRSREHQERFADLDIVRNQAFTNSPPPLTPPPPLGALPLLPAAPAPSQRQGAAGGQGTAGGQGAAGAASAAAAATG